MPAAEVSSSRPWGLPEGPGGHCKTRIQVRHQGSKHFCRVRVWVQGVWEPDLITLGRTGMGHRLNISQAARGACSRLPGVAAPGVAAPGVATGGARGRPALWPASQALWPPHLAAA